MSIMAMASHGRQVVHFFRVVQWYFWRVNMSTRRMPTVQVSFFVSIYSIYLAMAFDESTLLLSIMAMASHGRQFFNFSRVVCVGK
jgi:hypothetical protein